MPKTVLLSAYACEPGKGSEPGIGWNWALQLALQGHEVWVLTQPHFVPTIEKACQDGDVSCLHALPVRIPILDRWKSLLSRMGAPYWYAHAFTWQLLAFLKARALLRQRVFDWVHHITLGAARVPSFMGFLGLPFLFGPVAGGEISPWRLRRSFPLRGWLHTLLRDFSNSWLQIDPFVRSTFRQADWIIATSPQTQALIPARWRSKSHVQLAIGIEELGVLASPPIPGPFRMLFVGRLLYWKGLHLGLEAFAELRRTVPDARLTIIGQGPEQAWFKRRSQRLRLADAIDWVDWISRDDVGKAYAVHDVFLFPSLHDSGGMVVLEALSHGVPVVCLDLGGPGQIVDGSCGRIISTAGRSADEVIMDLGAALLELAQDPACRETLRIGAIAKAQDFAWPKVVARAYSLSSLPIAATPKMQTEGCS